MTISLGGVSPVSYHSLSAAAAATLFPLTAPPRKQHHHHQESRTILNFCLHITTTEPSSIPSKYSFTESSISHISLTYHRQSPSSSSTKDGLLLHLWRLRPGTARLSARWAGQHAQWHAGRHAGRPWTWPGDGHVPVGTGRSALTPDGSAPSPSLLYGRRQYAGTAQLQLNAEHRVSACLIVCPQLYQQIIIFLINFGSWRITFVSCFVDWLLPSTGTFFGYSSLLYFVSVCVCERVLFRIE